MSGPIHLPSALLPSIRGRIVFADVDADGALALPTGRHRRIVEFPPRCLQAFEVHMPENKLLVRKAAVLGAGVMGAQIAAHLVNCKVPILMVR